MNLPQISINSLYIKLSFVVSFIIIALALFCAYHGRYKYTDKADRPTRVALSALLVFSIHLIGYKLYYSFYTNVVAIIILVILVGLPYAIISMSIILLAETIFLSSSSIYMLGINIIAIAFFGSIITLSTRNNERYLERKNIETSKLKGRTLFTFHIVAIYAFLSIQFIWVFISAFISYTKNIPLKIIIFETIQTQMPFAIIEAIITLLFLIALYFIKQKNIDKFILITTLILTIMSFIMKTQSDIILALLEAYYIVYQTPSSIFKMLNIPHQIIVVVAEITIFATISFIVYSINRIRKKYKHN